jgi:Icc-related predicted phosphoesterase
MIIDCVADLHGHYPKLEGGDLLIVAGDLTARHTLTEFLDCFEWLHSQDYRKVIWIAGNHDEVQWERYLMGSAQFGCDPYDNPSLMLESRPQYLCDSGTEFEGLKIWGTPWTLTFEGINPLCRAFTDTEEGLRDKFALIPDDIDILISHGPPYGVFDIVEDPGGRLMNAGSEALLDAFARVIPTLHVFGHIHEGYAINETSSEEGKRCIMTNCSHVDKHYKPVNKPIRVIL